MKTHIFLSAGIVGIALSGLILTGCHKDSTTAPMSTSADITAAEDDANATFAANDSKSISDAAMAWNSNGDAPLGHGHLGGVGGIFGSCAIVSGKDTMIAGQEDTVVYINFGLTPCFCRDGRDRKGTIIVYWGLQHPGETWLQAYFDSANTITETFNNYYLKNNGIAGTRTWTNEGHNVNGYENWNFTANLKVTYPDGQVATWNSTRNNAITDVSSVWYYEITGSAQGTDRNGNPYSLTITSPVYFTVLPWWAGGCPWPEAGTISITTVLTSSMPARTITVNLGTLGTCTPDMFASLNGNRYSYTMW